MASTEATGSASDSASPETTVSAAPEEEPSLMGELDGDQYVNEALGFTATIPEGWLFSSDEDFKNCTGVDRDITKTLTGMKPESYEPVFVCSEYTYGEGSSGNPNINICYSNETVFKRILTESSVLESTSDMLVESFKSYFSSAIVEVVNQGTISIKDQKYTTINLKADFGDFIMYEDQLYTGIRNGVLVTTFTYFSLEEKDIEYAFMNSLEFED
jgi:hypothetical protein